MTFFPFLLPSHFYQSDHQSLHSPDHNIPIKISQKLKLKPCLELYTRQCSYADGKTRDRLLLSLLLWRHNHRSQWTLEESEDDSDFELLLSRPPTRRARWQCTNGGPGLFIADCGRAGGRIDSDSESDSVW